MHVTSAGNPPPGFMQMRSRWVFLYKEKMQIEYLVECKPSSQWLEWLVLGFQIPNMCVCHTHTHTHTHSRSIFFYFFLGLHTHTHTHILFLSRITAPPHTPGSIFFYFFPGLTLRHLKAKNPEARPSHYTDKPGPVSQIALLQKIRWVPYPDDLKR